jgi:predicted O-methyltransferase YrrM
VADERWSDVDHYFESKFVVPDAALTAAVEHSHAAGLPDIQVSPLQGRFLELLVRITGARKILEFGTLGGYSTIWMARALPAGGKLISLEFDPKHAEVARQNIANAGLSSVVEVRQGKAIDSLPGIAAEGIGPFDLVFIDADKPSTPGYVEWALRLSRPGTVIVVDNVVRGGEVAGSGKGDAGVEGIRSFADLVAAEPRLLATTIQNVGVKGYDGFAIALVTS